MAPVALVLALVALLVALGTVLALLEAHKRTQDRIAAIVAQLALDAVYLDLDAAPGRDEGPPP